MSWVEDGQVDLSNYTKLDVRSFSTKYPGVIDSEINIIMRIQRLFKIFEDANFSKNLPTSQVSQIKGYRHSFIEDYLRPLIDYNPRGAQPFGDRYNVSGFAEAIQQFFNDTYNSLASSAALIKSELFDYNLLNKYPKLDLEEVTLQFEVLRKKSKALPAIIKKMDEAEKTADEWIKQQNFVLEKLIETKSRELESAAGTHQGIIQYFWAVLAIVLGYLAYKIGWDTVNALKVTPTTEITLGFGLVKLSAVLAPLIAAYVCFNQYSYHRTMYDALSFRSIALANLATLSRQYPDSKNVIFEKGIDLIFDEPKSKTPQVKVKDIKDLMSLVKDR